jgi:hypothetical protein
VQIHGLFAHLFPGRERGPAPEASLVTLALSQLPKGVQIWGFFAHLSWKGEEGFYYSSGDLSNFMNHSYTPNLNGKQECLITVRDIQIGEELFVDYSEFCANFDKDEVKE